MKASKSEQVQKFINCYRLLKIDQLDSEIDKFISYNCAFYIDPKKRNYDLIVSDNGILVINRLDDSKFKMSFSPNMINPSMLSVELSNLGANLEKRIIISFDEVGATISVRKYYVSMTDGSKGASKERTDTIYIDGKKRYTKSQNHYIGNNIFEDSSYSRQVVTYYSGIDSSYVTNTKVVAEERAYYDTSDSYERFDGESYATITATEFIETVEKFEQEKKDIKQKNKTMKD